MPQTLNRAVIFVFFLFVSSLLAQNPTGNIVGRVQDQSGAVVPEVRIVVHNVDTSAARQAKTDASGDYTIPDLAPGQYQITAEKEGFRKTEERDLTLEIDQTLRLDLKLQIGSVSETVEVQATVQLVNTESPMKGDVIVAKEMVDIPLDGRDFGDLAYLVPGVSQKAQGGDGSNFAVNGARVDNTNFMVDGFFDQSPKGGTPQASPTIDSMMEFKMQTTGYSAEYGRLAGGAMNMVLKSGANRFHGTLFEFFRNDALDARNFFAIDKTKLRRNQFGGVADGPVYLPKLYNGRDKTFFLFSWESYRQLSGDFNLDVTPTPLQRQGIFSQAIADPFSSGKCGKYSGNCFPNNAIPKDRWDQIAVQVIPYYPLENQPGQKNNSYIVANDPDAWDSFVSKIDHRIGSSETISGRVLYRLNNTFKAFDGSPSGTFGTWTHNHQTLAGINYNHIFTPALINEARAGVSRTNNYQPGVGAGIDYASQWGLRGVTTDPKLVGFPSFTVNGIMPLGDAVNTPVMFTVNNYQWADTVTWVRARHMIKFGFDIVRTQYFQPYNNNNRGTFSFNKSWTGVGFSDLLLGVLNSSTKTVGANPNYLFFTNYGFFAQDDFKATSRLTLNVGLRYEIPAPPTEKYGHWSNFIPSLDQVVLASDTGIPNLQQMIAQAGLTGKMVLASTYGYPPSLIYANYKCFAPRFGFAWRLTGDTRSVVRGGYGIFYGGNEWNPIRNTLGNVFPFSIDETNNKNANNPSLLTLQNPWGTETTLNGVLTPNGFQLHQPKQYAQSWNLTVEREIGRGTALEIAYVGSKGTHLGRDYNINMPYPVQALQPQLPGGGFPRPYAGFSDIDYFAFESNSNYNAGIFTLRRRISRGIFFHASYTYSKSIDEASQIKGAADGDKAGAVDPRNLRLERGRSAWDRGHSFTALFMYELPFHQHWMLKNWQISGTERLQTGPPFTVVDSAGDPATGGSVRPDCLYKPALRNPTPSAWYDTSAFVSVPSGSYRPGTSGRNTLDGPGLTQVNVSLIKRIPIRERYYMQLRIESFNLLNHANFNLPNKKFDVAAGGTITVAHDPRTMQIAWKLQF